ncbi:hypothetical protein IAQ61_009861 [Plenodomus lingam]|uniref:uncharacterized protein n=1 Tax=Leptosphaeria maculans TaxID=5022 RepID=UPI003319D355|nr:hypothetical protein IAQ61_009861 [Plenodomus lingam]
MTPRPASHQANREHVLFFVWLLQTQRNHDGLREAVLVLPSQCNYDCLRDASPLYSGFLGLFTFGLVGVNSCGPLCATSYQWQLVGYGTVPAAPPVSPPATPILVPSASNPVAPPAVNSTTDFYKIPCHGLMPQLQFLEHTRDTQDNWQEEIQQGTHASYNKSQVHQVYLYDPATCTPLPVPTVNKLTRRPLPFFTQRALDR